MFAYLADYLIWALVAILYTPIFIQLYQSRWENIDYTHAYSILPVSLFLVWLQRDEIRRALARPQPRGYSALGLGLLVAGAFFLVFGWRMDFLMVSTLSLLPVLYGIILYRYNTATARALSFPILYLLLLVPPPLGLLDSLTLPMRNAVTMSTSAILGTFLPVQRDGMLLSMGQARVFVGEPCSGFRSLVSMFALALVYVHLIRLPALRKGIMLAAVVPLALVGNLLRVISLSLVTYYFGQEAGEGFFHGFSGIVIFAVMILGLLSLGRWLSDEDRYEG